MELVSGRPQNTEGRLGKEIRTYDFLDSIGIHYERVDHKPAMTIEACEEVDKILGAVICKNLFLFSDVRGCSSFLIKLSLIHI